MDRLSPARAKLGSLRRRRVTRLGTGEGSGVQGEKSGGSGGQGEKAGSQGEKRDEAMVRSREQVEREGGMFSGASLEGAVLNLGQHRSCGISVKPPEEVDSKMAVPPKIRSSLPPTNSPQQSLYDVPRLLAASSGQIMVGTSFSRY